MTAVWIRSSLQRVRDVSVTTRASIAENFQRHSDRVMSQVTTTEEQRYKDLHHATHSFVDIPDRRGKPGNFNKHPSHTFLFFNIFVHHSSMS